MCKQSQTLANDTIDKGSEFRFGVVLLPGMFSFLLCVWFFPSMKTFGYGHCLSSLTGYISYPHFTDKVTEVGPRRWLSGKSACHTSVETRVLNIEYVK